MDNETDLTQGGLFCSGCSTDFMLGVSQVSNKDVYVFDTNKVPTRYEGTVCKCSYEAQSDYIDWYLLSPTESFNIQEDVSRMISRAVYALGIQQNRDVPDEVRALFYPAIFGSRLTDARVSSCYRCGNCTLLGARGVCHSCMGDLNSTNLSGFFAGTDVQNAYPDTLDTWLRDTSDPKHAVLDQDTFIEIEIGILTLDYDNKRILG